MHAGGQAHDLLCAEGLDISLEAPFKGNMDIELAVDAMQLADQATKEGVPDLRASGLKKVKDGIISLEEVNRVTKD